MKYRVMLMTVEIKRFATKELAIKFASKNPALRVEYFFNLGGWQTIATRQVD